MFEQVFGKLSAVVHHKAAPYAAERERFLEHCIQQGYTRDWIKTVAARLLVAAYELHTHGGLRASPEEIEAAADRVQQLRSDLHRPGDAQEYRESLVRITTQWLAFVGSLRVPEVQPRPFAGLVDDFTQWMAQERGLSPETIRNRRWHVERFLLWLAEHGRHVSDLRIQDIDQSFEALHAKGFSRVRAKSMRMASEPSYATRSGELGVQPGSPIYCQDRASIDTTSCRWGRRGMMSAS